MVRYADGDTDAFELLFHRHKQSVYAFIRQYNIYTDMTDDLFQEVFLRIIRNRERYSPKAKFSTWLFTITRSVCIDAIRKGSQAKVISLFPERHNKDETPILQILSGTEPSPRETMFQTETQSLIQEIIQSLPEKQREILLLREKTDLTFEEIGKVLGCSSNTAKSRMHYALLALRKQLIERGFFLKEETV